MANILASTGKKFAITAALALGLAANAQAAGISGEITIQHSGGYLGGHGGGWQGRPGGWHGGHRAQCRPSEAIERAWRQGMRRPGIERVGRRDIVVAGWFRGHRAVLVFDRHSPRCRVIGSRGI